ncbi:MAG: type I-E CRISPR-associated protein Cse1/CasA [Flaviflexus sp.]|nr:type I-E CRISPR-associated protein Cse1/CasA [Flaviflexus sp.]
MSGSALREIAWIPLYSKGNTVEEYITVEEALTRGAKDSTCEAVKTRSLLGGLGYEAGAVIRFLASIVAVAERYRDPSIPRPAIDAAAVGKALDLLEPYCDLYSEERPFMQRRESPGSPLTKIAAEKVLPKNLSPTIPSTRSLIFWGLRTYPEVLSPAQATLALISHHYYSPAGNSSYEGAKPQMGAPGLRWPGKDLTATEIISCLDELYPTLLLNIPQSWVEGTSLPAWADRKREVSDERHELWRQTWSSNTAVANWDEEGNLIRAKDCGIPNSWYSPSQGNKKESRTAWWDQRNRTDPFYLYRANDKGKKTMKRLDIGRDMTELAVSWIAEGNASALRNHLISPARLYSSTDTDDLQEIVFLRHQMGGTGSSPSMRASEALIADPHTWAPHEQVLEELLLITDTFLQLRGSLLYRFRGAYSGEQATEAVSYLPELKDLRGDANATFWREVTPVFEELVTNSVIDNPTDEFIDRIVTEVVDATLRSYDLVTHAYERQYIAQISTVRRILRIACRSIAKTVLSGEEDA